MAILNGQFNSVQILCEEGKANTTLCNKNGDSLLHYAAITQGNASLYLRYLIEKRGVSTFVTNNAGLTPRQLAETTDKAKFHRVIKNITNYEVKENAKKKPEIVERILKVYEFEKGFANKLANNT